MDEYLAVSSFTQRSYLAALHQRVLNPSLHEVMVQSLNQTGWKRNKPRCVMQDPLSINALGPIGPQAPIGGSCTPYRGLFL